MVVAVNKRHFELAANGRNRRAQLVRNIGRELPDLVEGILQALDHPVEGFDQIVQLVARAARGNAQAEIRTGDALRGLGDFQHRRQRPRGQEPARAGNRSG